MDFSKIDLKTRLIIAVVIVIIALIGISMLLGGGSTDKSSLSGYKSEITSGRISGNATCEFTKLLPTNTMENQRFRCTNFEGYLQQPEIGTTWFEGIIESGTFTGTIKGDIYNNKLIGHIEGNIYMTSVRGNIRQIINTDMSGFEINPLILFFFFGIFIIGSYFYTKSKTVEIRLDRRDSADFDKIFKRYLAENFDLVVHGRPGYGIYKNPDTKVVSAVYQIVDPIEFRGQLIEVYDDRGKIFYRFDVGLDKIDKLHDESYNPLPKPQGIITSNKHPEYWEERRRKKNKTTVKYVPRKEDEDTFL